MEKRSRAVARKGALATHLLSVFSHRLGLALWQQAVADKNNVFHQCGRRPIQECIQECQAVQQFLHQEHRHGGFGGVDERTGEDAKDKCSGHHQQ